MVFCHSSVGRPILANETDEGLGLLVGDAPIARFLFGKRKEAKRKTIEKLRVLGWPIFDCGGKHAARPERLREHVLEREREAVERGNVQVAAVGIADFAPKSVEKPRAKRTRRAK
jgi:hypothetical protein